MDFFIHHCRGRRVSLVSSRSFWQLFRIILVGGKMNVCLLPLFTERIQTHLDTQIHNIFFLAGAGAGAVTVLSVASVIYDAIRFLLGQQIAKHQTS